MTPQPFQRLPPAPLLLLDMARARLVLLLLVSPVCFLVPFRTPLVPRKGRSGENQSPVAFHASAVARGLLGRSLGVSRAATNDEEVELDAGHESVLFF